MAIITDLSISYDNFENGNTIDPEEFDTNNSEIVDKINVIIAKINKNDSVADGDSGGDNILITPITDLSAGSIQACLEEIDAELTTHENLFHVDTGVQTIQGAKTFDSAIVSDGEITNGTSQTLGDSFQKLVDTLDNITDGATYVKSTNDYTDTEKTNVGTLTLGASSDASALHTHDDKLEDDFTGYIEKTAPISGDYFIINDSADSDAPKKLLLSNIPSAGGGVNTVFGRAGEVVAVSGDYEASEVTNAFDFLVHNLDDIDNGGTFVKSHNNYTDADLAIVADCFQISVDDTDNIIESVTKKFLTTLAQTISGIKTFGSFPLTPSADPTNDYDVSNKKYIDDLIASGPKVATGLNTSSSTVITINCGFKPKLVMCMSNASSYLAHLMTKVGDGTSTSANHDGAMSVRYDNTSDNDSFYTDYADGGSWSYEDYSDTGFQVRAASNDFRWVAIA